MSKKILVVDDDPGTVKTLESLLTSKGYEVDTAEDGLDALAKLKKSNPDCVVLDIVMPEINGYDVCCELRFNKDFNKVPILILTETDKEIEDDISKKVNIEYLQKPIKPEPLFEKIEVLLNSEVSSE